MELDSPGKISCAECISTPLSKITSTPPKHHSGTDCIDGISCPLGRIDPKGKQWIITYQRGRCVGNNWEWECKTDVPIILFAYVSVTPPWKKAGTHVKRGVVTHHDPTVYFPYDFISCQNEGGEVTEHTFTWPYYPDQQVFWWRCGGRTGGWFPKWSASRSPFWNAKCAPPAEQEATYQTYYDSCQVSDYGNSWANAWSGSGSSWRNINQPGAGYHRSYAYYVIIRTAWHFDTSALPLGSTVTGAKLRVKQQRVLTTPYSRYGNPVADDLCIVNAPDCPIPATRAAYVYLRGCNTIVAAKYFPAEALGWQWNEYDLNDAGKANVVPGGITTFGQRALKEIQNVDQGFVQFRVTAQAGTPPYLAYLDITYI